MIGRLKGFRDLRGRVIAWSVLAAYGLFTLAPVLHDDHAEQFVDSGHEHGIRLIGPACDGACGDPHHHHGPAGHHDHCVICRVLAQTAAAVVAIDGCAAEAEPAGRHVAVAKPTPLAIFAGSHAARAPPC